VAKFCKANQLKRPPVSIIESLEQSINQLINHFICSINITACHAMVWRRARQQQ